MNKGKEREMGVCEMEPGERWKKETEKVCE